MILSGKNLGERQRDLNSKVNDAVARNVNFDTIEKQEEVSDVDIFFKIDVALKYKNTDYIMKILKSEDTLHITRVLKKCDWLFDDEHSHIMNIYYLHNNIFPHMSTKMKKKMLTTISTRVKDENQAETFYNYCKTENLEDIANKFILYTSEAFKLGYIRKLSQNTIICFKKINLKFFFGNSFTLVEAYLKKTNQSSTNDFISDISYLYYESNEKYLDISEKYFEKFSFGLLGTKLTKDIAKKYKNRVLANAEMYVEKLDTKTLLKHSNLEEIKQYAAAELSKTSQYFWKAQYWQTRKLLVDAIPAKEKFDVVKDIFTKKNPGEDFETSDEFYTNGYYNLMTKKQKIEATKNYENETGNISRIKRNIWYSTVDFDTAFLTFQEKMLNNKNPNMRTNLLMVLIKATKSHQNLFKVLNYYQAIYNTEKVSDKEKFLKAICHHHQVFNLDSNCWTLLQKMLMDEEVRQIRCRPEKKYESIVYLYQILHNKEFLDDHKTFLETTSFSSFTAGLKKMKKKQRTKVIEYLFQYHVNRLYELDDTEYDFNSRVKNQIHSHVHWIINLIRSRDKSKDEIPEIAQKYILADWEEFHLYDILKDDQNNFMKRLKEDANTVKHFRTIIAALENDGDFKLLPLFRKIKIYFSHDIAKKFVSFFQYCLSDRYLGTIDQDYGFGHEYRVINAAVIGIYMLADDSYKQEINLHFKPTTHKIDYLEMDGVHLSIQEAVCGFGYFSRPPLPFSRLKTYLKGDYAIRCLLTVGSLFANLPTKSCLQLAETILSTPDSMLKYSFHLVFHRLSIEDLHEVVVNVMKNTKHRSVRRDLFALMFRAILQASMKMQRKLLECFKEMASCLPEYDEACYHTLRIMNKPIYVSDSTKDYLVEVFQKWAPKKIQSTGNSLYVCTDIQDTNKYT